MPNLEMPSFDDFLLDMGQDRIIQWTDEANAAVANLPTPLPVDEQTASVFATRLVSMSNKITIAMLRDYHEWLTAQLAQRSVHLLK